ncbi:MAG: hypothetical protein ACO3A2_00515 [Bdellovibrionia bacterium]
MNLIRNHRWSWTVLGICFVALGILGQASVGRCDAPVLPVTPKEGGVEPSYCDPDRFDATEIRLSEDVYLPQSGLKRIHAFQLGQVTLVGLGVGDSSVQAVKDLAQKYAPQMKAKGYCTWYLNHPKVESDLNKKLAAQTFIHKDILKNPMSMDEQEVGKAFMEVIGSSFDQEPTSFLSCVTGQKYLALGCNGMMHRGPTVFGMVLAFSGCSPSHALEISNQIWGLNGVKRKVRLSAIQKAYELGERHPESRKRMQDAFLGTERGLKKD